MAIRVNPRPMVRIGDYYGPAPRKIAGNIEPVAGRVRAGLADVSITS